MNRREMVILPGIAALAASSGLAQTQRAEDGPSPISVGLSHKLTAHYGRLKSFYRTPKSEAKQAKYVGFLTTLLTLTPGQQTQLAGIFASASATHSQLKAEMKAAHQSLARAVAGNDEMGIGRDSLAIGRLVARRYLTGAGANAAFRQILTPDQQARLNQLRTSGSPGPGQS
jgi:Spy/CpxP family protein refolding chaperone